MTEDFICEDCNEKYESIFALIEHKEIDIQIPVRITNEISMDLWNIFRAINEMVHDEDYEAIKMVTDAIGTTLYSAAQGTLDDIVDEMYIEDSLENLDEKLKELLDEQTNNDN